MWFRRKVQSGQKLGRKIGFPTLNFNIGSFSNCHSAGVYSVKVRIKEKIYKGALFYGRKSSSQKDVLELHVLGMKEKLYGQLVSFSINHKIRDPMLFTSLDALKNQIKEDVAAV